MNQDLFNKFLELINPNKYCNPVFNSGTVFTLSCKVAFEANNKATETWENYWELLLPTYPYYWIGLNDVLKKGSDNLNQGFKGATADLVLKRAIKWLELYNKQILGE